MTCAYKIQSVLCFFMLRNVWSMVPICSSFGASVHFHAPRRNQEAATLQTPVPNTLFRYPSTIRACRFANAQLIANLCEELFLVCFQFCNLKTRAIERIAHRHALLKARSCAFCNSSRFRCVSCSVSYKPSVLSEPLRSRLNRLAFGDGAPFS